MYISRKVLLKYQTKSESDCTPLVLTYHSYLRLINKIVKNLQPLINKDPHLNQIFSAHHLYHIVNLLTSNVYLHLPPYQMKILSRAPFPANLLHAISVPT